MALSIQLGNWQKFLGNRNGRICQFLEETADSALALYSKTFRGLPNPAQPWAEAVAIRDGIIVAVGDEADVLALADEDAHLIDLDGAMLMPGFQDPHLHVLEAGLNETLCFVSDFADFEIYIDEIRACAADQPESEWVRAAGANMAGLLRRGRLPIDLLDEAVGDRPVIILDDLGHGAWLNSLAMEAVGYSEMEGDPTGGILVRDPASGQLTGLVLENAQQRARTASLTPTSENLELAYQGLLLGLAVVAEHGITTVSDAGGYWTRGHHLVWQRAADEGTLTARANNALYVFPDQEIEAQLAQFEALYSNDSESLLRFSQAKIYVDGILSQGTGAVLEPYSQSFGIPGVPSNGFLYFDEAVLGEYVVGLTELGFQLHFHVTGDRGARIALDAIEGIVELNGGEDGRHRLTHLYLVNPANRLRFAELGVVADFQFAAVTVGDAYAAFMEPHIGARSDQLLPLFSLYEQEAVTVLSSDWDADTLSPFEKMETVLKTDHDGMLTRDDVIRMLTLDVAYLLHQDEISGSIEPGKAADLVVVSRNLLEANLNDISRTIVYMTIVDGNEVYRHPRAEDQLWRH